MNVPLSWLADYVKLPKDNKALTDRLTAIGHMLDKTKKIGVETIIDLELRGNRADMFGLIGIARDISAALDEKLVLPEIAELPKKDKQHALVEVVEDAKDLVTRYEALRLKVKVGASPKWLSDRLNLLGIPSINNVVDITNYAMWETGQPLHAFDYNKIQKLVLRKAKTGEKFQTITQGQEVVLTKDDLVITDGHKPQALTMIGGLESKVGLDTTEIILEAAVYDSGNARRTARRLKIITEAGLRHEKHLDPEQVEFALRRAIYLLQEHASAKVEGLVSDYYPKPVKPKIINFDFSEVKRLAGIDIPEKTAREILEKLGFVNNQVPSFRTDIEGSADLVEEIVRIYGYDKVPSTPLSDALSIPQSYPSYLIQEKLRDCLTKLALNEVITLTMVPNDWAIDGIRLTNPPDPDRAYLRTNLMFSLNEYAVRLLNLNQEKVAIFEVGKVFYHHKEYLHLGLAINDLQTLKGVLDKLQILLGTRIEYETKQFGSVFVAEIDVDKLLPSVPFFANYYSVISKYPPIVEDVNIMLEGDYDKLIAKIKKLSDLITKIELIDNYENKLTLRITYHSDEKQLSSEDVVSIREKLSALN